jgi:hypothetical protein
LSLPSGVREILSCLGRGWPSFEAVRVDSPLLTKVCSRCDQEKPVEAFHRDTTKPDGHRAMRGDCARRAQNARDSLRIAPQHREEGP